MGRVGDAFGASCERRRADRPARRLHSSGSANGEPRVSALLRRCVVSYSDKRGLIAKRAAVRRSFLFGVCCRSYFGAWIANEVAAGARSRDIAAGRRPLDKPKASRRPRPLAGIWHEHAINTSCRSGMDVSPHGLSLRRCAQHTEEAFRASRQKP